MTHCYSLLSQDIPKRLNRAVPSFPITRTRKRVGERLYLQLKPNLQHVKRSYAEPARSSVTFQIELPKDL